MMMTVESWLVAYIAHAGPVAAGMLTFLLAELVLPRSRATWAGRLQAAAFWAIYFVAPAAAILMAKALQDALHITPLFRFHAPWPLAVLLVGLITDFFYYWFHRAQHAVPMLWRFHAVHHAIRDLSAINSYHHWTEELIRVFTVTLPVAALIQVDYRAAPYVGTILLLQSYLLHANTRVSLGPINRLFADNRTHRVHHSIEPEHFGKNYGGFSTVWDQLFGTAYFPAKAEWPDVGLADDPEPVTVADFLLRPFRPQQAASRSQPKQSPI